MIQILLLHGPNLNMLGRRDPALYGHETLAMLVTRVQAWAHAMGAELSAYQSNHEGALIDEIQRERDVVDGALVNLGAFTHTSYALHDALVDFAKPVVEVHLSKISEREDWRRTSVVRPACVGHVEGKGAAGYEDALRMLVDAIRRLS